jgi:hypothetical protein
MTMVFLSACAIGIPLLVAWAKIRLWDWQARRDTDRS